MKNIFLSELLLLCTLIAIKSSCGAEEKSPTYLEEVAASPQLAALFEQIKKVQEASNQRMYEAIKIENFGQAGQAVKKYKIEIFGEKETDINRSTGTRRYIVTLEESFSYNKKSMSQIINYNDYKLLQIVKNKIESKL